MNKEDKDVDGNKIEQEKHKILSKLKNSYLANVSLDVRVFTCTIGKKPT
jgi:hypothetical protein